MDIDLRLDTIFDDQKAFLMQLGPIIGGLNHKVRSFVLRRSFDDTLYDVFTTKFPERNLVVKETKKFSTTAPRAPLEAHYLNRASDLGVTPKFLGFKECEEEYYLIAEKIFGYSLMELIDHKYYGPETAKNHLVCIIKNLQTLMNQGILLRELTPSQIMVTDYDPYMGVKFTNMSSAIGYHKGVYTDTLDRLCKHPLDQYYTAENSLPYEIGLLFHSLLTSGNAEAFRNVNEQLNTEVFWPCDLQVPDEFKALVHSCLREPENRIEFSKILDHEAFKPRVSSKSCSLMEAQAKLIMK